MRAYLLVAVVLAGAAGAAEYKCKDSKGNWTAEACTGTAAPPSKPSRPAPAEDGPEVVNVKNFCASKWPGDYRMQSYCVGQQRASAGRLAIEFETLDNDDLKIAAGNCALKWTEGDLKDWRMIEYCWNQQKTAYNELRR